MRRWYLYKRANRPNYYADILDENGRKIGTRSTGTISRDEAAGIAALWARDGMPDREGRIRSTDEARALADILAAIRGARLEPPDAARIVDELRKRGLLERVQVRPTLASRQTVEEFSRGMFNEGSEYLAFRSKRGRKLSNSQRRHAEAVMRRHILPLIGREVLVDISRARLEKLQDELTSRPRATGGAPRKDGEPIRTKVSGALSARSVNYIMAIFRMITKAAMRRGVIYTDPFVGLEPLSVGKQTRRGILNPDELARLFATDPDPWPSPWSRIMFTIAASTGLRKGELQALRLGSFFEQADRQGRAFAVVRVGASWDRQSFKAPKNGRERVAVVPPRPWVEVRAYLEELVRQGKGPDDLVFQGGVAGKPFAPGVIDYSLHRALAAIGIDKAARAARGLSAHSFRYLVNSRLINAGVAAVRVQSLLGHVSGDAMTARYYQAGQEFADVLDALE